MVKPKIPPPMHELTIPRSKLGRRTTEGPTPCLLAHVLRAAGVMEKHPYYCDRVPRAASGFYEESDSLFACALRGDVWRRVIRPFDEGRDAEAIANLRDFGWSVTIVEDQEVAP